MHWIYHLFSSYFHIFIFISNGIHTDRITYEWILIIYILSLLYEFHFWRRKKVEQTFNFSWIFAKNTNKPNWKATGNTSIITVIMIQGQNAIRTTLHCTVSHTYTMWQWIRVLLIYREFKEALTTIYKFSSVLTTCIFYSHGIHNSYTSVCVCVGIFAID